MHLTDCETHQWIFDQQDIAMKDILLKSATFFNHTQSEETAFVTNTCTMNGNDANVSCIYCMYNESSWEYTQIFSLCKWEMLGLDFCEGSCTSCTNADCWSSHISWKHWLSLLSMVNLWFRLLFYSSVSTFCSEVMQISNFHTFTGSLSEYLPDRI